MNVYYWEDLGSIGYDCVAYAGSCCIRCGVVMNNRNAEAPCIGVVKVELRRAPVEGGGAVYTDDEPITE